MTTAAAKKTWAPPPLKIVKRGEGRGNTEYWIINGADRCPEYGPYTTKDEAEEDREGMERSRAIYFPESHQREHYQRFEKRRAEPKEVNLQSDDPFGLE